MRSPRANLESLYGGGPVGSPYLYSRDDPAKLLEDDGDVPRNQEGIALLGDPRNDTHVFMSQMQLAFIRAQTRWWTGSGPTVLLSESCSRRDVAP